MISSAIIKKRIKIGCTDVIVISDRQKKVFQLLLHKYLRRKITKK